VGVLEVVKKRPGVVGNYVTCRRWGCFLLVEVMEWLKLVLMLMLVVSVLMLVLMAGVA
jgi:hypothetical protein